MLSSATPIWFEIERELRELLRGVLEPVRLLAEGDEPDALLFPEYRDEYLVLPGEPRGVLAASSPDAFLVAHVLAVVGIGKKPSLFRQLEEVPFDHRLADILEKRRETLCPPGLPDSPRAVGCGFRARVRPGENERRRRRVEDPLEAAAQKPPQILLARRARDLGAEFLEPRLQIRPSP